MSEMTCKIVFLIGFTTVLAVRFYFARLLQSSKVKDDRKTPLEIVLLGLTLLGMFILPLIGIFTPGWSLPTITYPVGQVGQEQLFLVLQFGCFGVPMTI